MKTLFLILLSLVSVSANPFLPILAGSVPTSYFPADAGMQFRWVASDLSGSPVSSWTDRITGSVMTQATGGNQPTWNSSDGVIFDGVDDFLTITNLPFWTPVNSATLVVLKFNSTAANKTVLGNMAGGELWLGIGDTPAFLYSVIGGNGALGPISTSPFDFFTCMITTNAANYGHAFTNGLIGWTGTLGNGWNNVMIPGWPRLGRGSGNFPFSGNVQEIIVWTNYIWTPQQVTNVHRYVTNTYGIP